jgi:hypothetical protein
MQLVPLLTAIHVNDLASKSKPKAAATVSCAGQSYTVGGM